MHGRADWSWPAQAPGWLRLLVTPTAWHDAVGLTGNGALANSALATCDDDDVLDAADPAARGRAAATGQLGRRVGLTARNTLLVSTCEDYR